MKNFVYNFNYLNEVQAQAAPDLHIYIFFIITVILQLLHKKIFKKMVRTCCVERCKRTSRPDDGVSFFSFPLQNEDLLNKWLEIIPTKNRISEYTQICSTHFEESQYRCMSGRRYLKKDAIPCIFPFDIKVHKTSEKKKDQILRCQQNTSKHMSNNIRNHYDSHCNMQKQEILLTNVPLSSILNTVDRAIQSTPRTQSIAIQVSPKQLAQSENEKNLRQQIKILQNRLRYRELRISNVCQLIKQLKKKGKCSDQLEKVLLRSLSVFNSKLLQKETEDDINIKKHSDTKLD